MCTAFCWGKLVKELRRKFISGKAVVSVAGFAISGVEPVDSTATLLLKYYHL
jgi:hypothetical protein